MRWRPISSSDALNVYGWREATARQYFWARGDCLAVRHELAREVALRFQIEDGTPIPAGLVTIDELPPHPQYTMALLELRP